MKNYQKVNVPAGEARVELHDSLNLTGAEVSISNLPAGAGVPFVHSHKQNEEIYAVLSGRRRVTGFAWLRQENANCRLRQTAPSV